jgi:hypothetical protein
VKTSSVEADPEAIDTARQILDAHLRLRDTDAGYDLQGEIAKAITAARCGTTRAEAVIEAAWRAVEQRSGYSKHMAALYDALTAYDAQGDER